MTAQAGNGRVGKRLRHAVERERSALQADSPPAFAFTRGVSSEEDMVKPLRTRWARGYREDGAVESALCCTKAEALAVPNGRAQDVRSDVVLARAKMKQPLAGLSRWGRDAMVKEVKRR